MAFCTIWFTVIALPVDTGAGVGCVVLATVKGGFKLFLELACGDICSLLVLTVGDGEMNPPSDYADC